MIGSPEPGGGEPGGWGGAPGNRPPRGTPTWLLVLAVVLACYMAGFAVQNLRGTRLGGAVDTLFPRVGQGNAIDENAVDSAWNIVRDQYVRRDVPGSTGTAGAVQGIIDTLRQQYNDRFSQFFSKEQYAQLQDSLNGRRSGSIGVELQSRCAKATLCPAGAQATVVAIESVLRGQPADKAGLRNGDILVKVGGTSLASLAPAPDQQIDKAGTLIRGDPGGAVTLTVQRGAQMLDLRVTRENLNVPAVYSMRFGRTLYLQVTEFNTDSGKDATKALSDAIASGAGSVVLDLRDNPGGLVSEAQSIASQFLTPDPSKNEVNVVVRRGRLDQNGDPGSAQRTDSDAIIDSGVARAPKLAVLVDANSASASEIVAAALQDYHRGLVFGEKTFGKGSVQEDFALPDGADLHLTVEKWFGPAGESIDGTGITPDRAVPIPDGDHRFRLDAQAPDPSADPQLQAALKYVQH